MKKLFVSLLAVLLVASLFTRATLPERNADRPVLHWKTDANPQRHDQIELFHRWLVRKGHVDADGKPSVTLALDTATNQSKLIQAVSGVGGDVMDADARLFAALGVARPLPDRGGRAAYDFRGTYPGLEPLLVRDGRQYAYPCNVIVAAWLVNRDALARFGVAELPAEWTPEEFEAIASGYVRRANAGLQRQEYFFGASIGGLAGYRMITYLVRSQGFDLFNETLTAAVCADRPHTAALETLHRWTYRDHFFPTAAEVASASAEAGYGGLSLAQFASGRYAAVNIGRYALIRLRQLPVPIRMGSVLPPMYGFKNLTVHARTAILYAGSAHPDAASLFFDFLADREYNDYLVEGADGLPPNPRFAVGNPAFLAPPGRENETDIHANELRWAQTLAIVEPSTPYYPTTGVNWIADAIDRRFNNLADSRAAMREAEARYNQGIRETLRAVPAAREAWEADRKRQDRIDRLKEEGRPIPADLIRNPFHRVWYRSRGLLAPPAHPVPDPSS